MQPFTLAGTVPGLCEGYYLLTPVLTRLETYLLLIILERVSTDCTVVRRTEQFGKYRYSKYLPAVTVRYSQYSHTRFKIS
jgi:hypothetical protein